MGKKFFGALPVFWGVFLGPPGNYISGNGAGNELQRNDVIPPGKAGPETRRHCSPVQGKTGKERKTRGKWGKPKKKQGKPGENGENKGKIGRKPGETREKWEIGLGNCTKGRGDPGGMGRGGNGIGNGMRIMGIGLGMGRGTGRGWE